jgi:hypothetical protein
MSRAAKLFGGIGRIREGLSAELDNAELCYAVAK